MVPSEILVKILLYSNSLIKQQKKKGAWHQNEPSLQSVVLTCQNALLLSLFTGKKYENALNKAMSWLNSPAVATNEYSYWRALPFIEVGFNKHGIDDALRQTKEKIKNDVLHHENSPIKEYYCWCIYKANETCAVADTIISDLKAALKGNIGGRASSNLSHITSLLCATNKITIQEATKALDQIVSKSEASDGMRKWTSLVSTSYIIINLVDIQKTCHFPSIKKRVDDLLMEAGKYLTKRWNDDDFKSPPNAGGDFETTSFSKTVSARALVALSLHKDQRCFEGIITDKSEEFKFRVTVWGGLASGLIMIMSGEYLIDSIGSIDAGASHWQNIGRVADVLGLSAILYSVATFIKAKIFVKYFG